MVMPKLPFNLFDFKHIDYFEPIFINLTAAAGDAIPLTTLYTVPAHKLAWLQSVGIYVGKITATALVLSLTRAQKIVPATTFNHALIKEDAATGEYSWPSAKTTTEYVFAWHPLFMHAGDFLTISQTLTIAETINHKIIINRIEYDDPRYEK